MRFLFLLCANILWIFSFGQDLEKKVAAKKAMELSTPISDTISPPMVEDKLQESRTDAFQKEGELKESKDERIDLLIQDYTESKKTIGYRVQLFSGNSRWEAVKVKADFMKKYKEEKPPHLVYQSPNFKIRVGDYYDRLEAQKYLELYKEEYPSAFVVKDEIEISTTE